MTTTSADTTSANPSPGSAAGSDYEVGYGRPPESARFKKGQSGNPKGRPKKAAGNLLSFLDTLLTEDLPTGNDSTMTKQEAFVRTLFDSATEGKSRAFQKFVDLATRAGLFKDLLERSKRNYAPITFELTLASTLEKWEYVKERMAELLAIKKERDERSKGAL